MSVRLNRAVVQATIDDPDSRGGLTIYLSQPVNGISWNIKVYAKADEGLFELGRFTTSIPQQIVGQDVRTLSRVVAIANCPGAKSWTLEIARADSDDEPDHSKLSMAVGCCIGPPGVTRVGERYRYYTGVDGLAQILPGDRIVGWTAIAGPLGGSVVFAPSALLPVVIPPNASLSGSTGGNQEGLVNMIFAGTLSYIIEVARSA